MPPSTPLRRLIERLLTLAIALAAGLVLFSIVDRVLHMRAMRAAYVAEGTEQAARVAERIDAILVRGTSEADALAERFADPSAWEEATIVEAVRERSEANPNVLGITVAFEPDVFPGRHLYAPFYDQSDGAIIQIEDSYDYTDAALETAQWYVEVRDHGARWVEPYFAQGAQAMVADYGVPFSGPDPMDPSRERVLGTVTVTIGLAGFQDLLDALSLGSTGYGFVVSGQGAFLAHPNGDYIEDRTLADVADERGDEDLGRIAEAMVAGETGVADYRSDVSDQPALLFHHPIPSSGWSLGLVYMTAELGRADDVSRRKALHIALAVGLLLGLALAKLLRVSTLRRERVWAFSTSLSVLLLALIVVIWTQNLAQHGTGPEANERRVSSIAGLDRFVERQRRATTERNDLPLIVVPTGIQVREVDFLSPYQVSVSMLLWQKYPLDRAEELPRALMFPSMAPTADAIQLEEIHRERARDHELVRWAGQVTFRLPFDYGRYPFDERIIRLQLASPALDRNVLLTPDLPAYDLLNPGALPGVRPDIVLPSSRVASSYFHYTTIDNRLTVGSSSRHRWADSPQLFFDMVLKRDVLNAFIKNFIIIFIVALMLFLILASTTRRKDLKSEDMSPFSIIQVAAAFFFVLVLAHIDLRSDLDTGSITYMEYFYFILYFMLLLVVYNVIFFMRERSHRIFLYEDNLIVKTLYWPTFLGASFVVTLLRFY